MEMVEIPYEEEIPVTRTKHLEKRIPPPPMVKPSTETLPDEVEFTPEPEPEPIPEKVVLADTTSTKEFIAKPLPTKAKPKPIPLPEPPDDEIVDLPFMPIEDMPRFQGCEALEGKEEKQQCATKKMLEYIYSQIRYPAMARHNGIEGIVVVAFVVERDGSLSNMEIVKDIGGGCGKEALRVVKGMPRWIPGKQRGKAVRVRFQLPVKYKLR